MKQLQKPRFRGRVTLLALATLVWLSGSSAPGSSAPGSSASGSSAQGSSASADELRSESGLGRYVLVLLATADTESDLSEDERKTAMAGHFENMGRLAEAGKLLLAGPLGPPRSDPAHRGIFIFDVTDLDQAHQLASTDPSIQAGIFQFSLHSFTTDAPIRRLPAMEKAAAAAREADPDIPDAWQGRPYVLASAPANLPLDDTLLADESTLMFGKLSGPDPDDSGRWLVFLDAENADTASARRVESPAGTWTLHGWYGTTLVAQMADH